MKGHIFTLTTCAFILVCGAAGASAKESTGDRSHEGYGMMGHGGMMGHEAAMRFIFALMDSDGDGTVSLQEFQAAHEKLFKAMDTDKDGTLYPRGDTSLHARDGEIGSEGKGTNTSRETTTIQSLPTSLALIASREGRDRRLINEPPRYRVLRRSVLHRDKKIGRLSLTYPTQHTHPDTILL